MPLNTLKTRTSIAVLAALLLLETGLVISLRTLGWTGTGSVIQLIACTLVTALPLIVAGAMLANNRFRFGIRSAFLATALVAIFLTVSMMPLIDYRSARRASGQLLSANATLNEGLDWDEFYTTMGLEPPAVLTGSTSTGVPPWLIPFTKHLSTIPPDDTVRSIWLNSDDQIRILANNWQRFPSLQSVSVTSGVTADGFELLRTTLPRFEHLVSIHTNDVAVPNDWYRSLTNIRTLWVWGEGMSRGKPFPKEHLRDIVSLTNLETLMVLGYAFGDSDAQTLSSSPSIKRIILRGTAVTPTGESALSDDTLDRIVYRN